jgi:hypothetical protein
MTKSKKKAATVVKAAKPRGRATAVIRPAAMAAKKAEAKRGTAQKAPTSKLAALKSLLTGGKAKAAVAAGAKKAPVAAKAAPAKGGKAAAKAPVKGAAKSGKELGAKGAPAKGGKAAAPAPAKTAGKAAAPAPAPVPAKGAKSAAKGAVAPAAVPAAAPATAKKGRAQAPVFSLRQAVREATSEAVCREVACEGLATTLGYCRLHYIKNWKKIKRKEVILKEGKLNQYIEELVAKYPDKYLEAIRQDLTNDKDFAKVIYDLDLDESVDEFDAEGENVEGIIDTIKRDFEDDGEAF